MFCSEAERNILLGEEKLKFIERGHILDRRRAAATADIIGKALGVERIVGQKVEPLPLHLATAATVDAPHLQFQKNPRVATRQIAYPPHLAIVQAVFLSAVSARSRAPS